MENKEYWADLDNIVLQRKQWMQNHCGQLLYTVCNLKSLTAPCKEETASAVLLSIPYLGPSRVPPPSHVTVSSALLPRAWLGLAAAEAVVDLLCLPLQPAVLGAVDLQGAVPQPALRRALALPRDVPPEPRKANISLGAAKKPQPHVKAPAVERIRRGGKALGLWGSGTLQVTCSGVLDVHRAYTGCFGCLLPKAFGFEKYEAIKPRRCSLGVRNCHLVPLTGTAKPHCDHVGSCKASGESVAEQGDAL